MKLKSLEIEGFKSFSNKTLLVFDQSVTGIVGPNGCGKSNVVDAIRWVMGEQSAKHLRGKSMDDVIFAGARDQGPSSVAGVELTFTTDGAQTPPQYAGCKEISVGRKLYRSGESEYFVNKQAVRLKDVKDLFLGTGVGVNAYSIIEQGSIGQMVTAKPEDRRRIIEEAAGISKFQIRKEAAHRKMEATNQNLLRLRDIIAELERQKGSLERQAKKAEKFKLIRDELMALDLALASTDYAKLDTRQEALVAEMRELDANLAGSEAALADGEVQFEERRLVLVEAERTASDAQQSVYEADNVLGVAESRLAARRDELSRLEREAAEESSRCALLIDRLLQSKNALWESNAAAMQAEWDVVAGDELMTSLETAHSQTLTQSQSLFEELEVARRDFHESGKRLVAISGRRQSLTQRIDELTAKLAADREELEAVSDKAQRLTKLLHEAQEGLSDVRQIKLSLDEKTTEVAAELAICESAISGERVELEGVKESLLRKKSRLHSLEELERNFEGYQDGPKTILERKRGGEMESVLGAVADFIATEPRYEGAVSAVLGERAQCLVVNGATESVACAEWLKSVNSGRSAFVALGLYGEQTVSERVVATSMAPGNLGLLSDVVTAKTGFENLKKALFGDTVLVETLSHAFDTWQNARVPVATLDGEVIDVDGILHGGSLEKTSKALLEKKREIKDLHAEIAVLVDTVKAKEEICFDLDRKLKSLRARLEEMRASTHAEELRLAGQEKDVTHSQRELEGLNDRRQRLSQQIFDADESLSFLREDAASLEEHDLRERDVSNAAERLLNGKKAEEDAFRWRLREEQDILTREKIAQAQARERKTSLDRETERLSAEVIRLRGEITAAEERLALLEKRRIFVADRMRFGEKNITRLLEFKTIADARYAESRTVFDGLNSEILEQEIVLKDARRTVSVLKDRLNAATLDLTELRNRLTRLKEQTFERYQLSLSEVFEQHLANIEESDQADKITRAEELRGQMQRAGSVNLGAIDELREVSERFEFLDKQRVDLESSLASLEQAIQKINQTTKVRFAETFELVNQKFSQLFPKLFEGGEAHLKLTDPENMLETGVEIIAQPPGKKLQSITLLSGGEKALTAVSLLFAIFLIKPSPFCLLDEVDAPLDDANVDRYNEIVKEMSSRTQFIVITHNKRTMQVTDALYGVTMEKSGISQLVSVNLGN